MYKHHVDSAENMKELFAGKGAIAVVLIGSVAKGTEREDSDIDGVVVLTDEAYKEKDAAFCTSETIDGLCTYPGGYFDIKYVTVSYLEKLRDSGSEPARSTYTNCRVLYCTDDKVRELIESIPVFQRNEKDEKMLSFYSFFWVSYYYYYLCCKPTGYMKLKTVTDVIYAAYRLFLQENEILFDCSRRLESQVKGAGEEGEKLVSLAEKVEESMADESMKAFADYFCSILKYAVPNDINVMLTQYARDIHEWWKERRPNIMEW